MLAILLLLFAPEAPHRAPVPRRDYRAVIRDIEKLQAAGSKDEAKYTKLANEIAGGVYDF